MSTFTLTFKTDNAAFRFDDETLDVESVISTAKRATRKVADQEIASGETFWRWIMDANGNNVGTITIEED